jgi:hypothetical protein
VQLGIGRKRVRIPEDDVPFGYGVQLLEPGRGAAHHRHGTGAVDVDDNGRKALAECVIQEEDPGPVRRLIVELETAGLRRVSEATHSPVGRRLAIGAQCRSSSHWRARPHRRVAGIPAIGHVSRLAARSLPPKSEGQVAR